MGKNRFFRWAVIWVAAILITLAALIYQNLTGPTHPVRDAVKAADGRVYAVKLPRSHGGNSGCLVKMVVPDTGFTGEMLYRRFPTTEMWQQTTLERTGDTLLARLPHQPPAGKLEYHIMLRKAGRVVRLPAENQVVIRFRGDVPASVIIPHASLMFLAMLLANITLLLALFGFRQYRLYAVVTTSVLLVGGLLLGPVVQKYAFGEYWTGFPFGFDLTDNKTLIAFVFWLLALAGNLYKERRYLTILAGIVMLLIFSIPHSARGSELDPESGEIKTGMVR